MTSCHLAMATEKGGKVRGMTFCGIRPGVGRGIHWTDETAKVRGCPDCRRWAEGIARGAYTCPVGIVSNGAPR